MRRTPPLLLLLCLTGGPLAGAVYEVGPSQSLTTIGEVPWESLEAGDTVRIHWKPDPYREKWVIGRSGRSDAPITVQGVPGPGGERPVISGNGATTRLALDYWNEERGLIKIGGSSVPPTTTPEWIVIEGLELRSAHPDYAFTDDGGNASGYVDNAAGVYVEYGRNLVIRDCIIHDNGNGIFIGSPDGDPTRDVVIEGNWIHGNGNVGSAFHHNTYTTALGIVIQDNHYGPLRPGADGNNLKDRSAGTVIRTNWIVGGNRQLDLVDANLGSLIQQDPTYRRTFVYGNVLVETEGSGNRQMIHYGGDGGDPARYRKGLLHLYNNTMVSERAGRTTLLRLSTVDERCDARNNIVHLPAASGDQLELVSDTGTLDWSHNWLEPGWEFSFFGTQGTFNDDGTTVEGTEPGFVDGAAGDFHLRSDSPCRDAGTALHPDVLPDHDVLRQPVFPRSSEPRPDDGTLDIGAYEHASTPPPDEVQGLRILASGTLTWDPEPAAEDYDLVRGDLFALAGGLGASVVDCPATGVLTSSWPDTTALLPSGGQWYLVRGVNAGGAGTWGAGRDAAIAAAPGACPP